MFTNYIVRTRYIQHTLNTIKDEIKDNVNISKSLIAVTLHEYLRKINDFLSLGFDIVFLDVTWVNQNYTLKYSWISNKPYVLHPVDLLVKDKDIKETELIHGCNLVFSGQENDVNYHKQMNGQFIAFPTYAKKPELYEIIKRNKPVPVYKTDALAYLYVSMDTYSDSSDVQVSDDEI
ncbi:hypothetical protein KUTeg_002964 [Tegillarca granosa]|uniref:Uncharacterized protein n=1 Tax=Tegillarca granosa TaxID=220873 RepID=A0ABQ9FKQ1_TEGGR|nr:hypothetical protein KUTeg_002964 [Tegillarca granosa]